MRIWTEEIHYMQSLHFVIRMTLNCILLDLFGLYERRGKTLAEPLAKIPYFPNMVTQMISIGEQTGNIDQMLGKVADFYEDEVVNATDAMTSLLEPILMVVLGGVIAVIVIAMYLPIFNMANTIQ